MSNTGDSLAETLRGSRRDDGRRDVVDELLSQIHREKVMAAAGMRALYFGGICPWSARRRGKKLARFRWRRGGLVPEPNT